MKIEADLYLYQELKNIFQQELQDLPQEEHKQNPIIKEQILI